MTLGEYITYCRAMLYAFVAHAGQVDKAGKPYFGHLVRVSRLCKTPDTMEDTATTYAELIERFGERIAFEVRLLTQTHTVGRGDRGIYIDFIAQSPIAREVKIADLTDNMNLTRLRDVSLTDAHRQRTYSRELIYLLKSTRRAVHHEQ